MTPKQYRKAAQRTRKGDLSRGMQVFNAALGLAGEAGEVVDGVKKTVFHGHEHSREKAIEELGDVLYYLDWLAELAGTNIKEVMEANILKLTKRYPNGFNSERSKNR